MKMFNEVCQNAKLSQGECVLRDRSNNCSYYGGCCELNCKLYSSVVNDVKKLLDSEAEKDTMTVHPKEKIVSAIMAGDAIVAQALDNSVVGFVYLVHWSNHIEIAGLVVESSFRQYGLGKKLFKEALSLSIAKYEEKQVIFFANNVSRKLGEKNGFTPMPQLITDSEFQDLCKNCTKEYRKPQDCRCHVMICK